MTSPLANLECGALHRFGSNDQKASILKNLSHIPFDMIQNGRNRHTPKCLVVQNDSALKSLKILCTLCIAYFI